MIKYAKIRKIVYKTAIVIKIGGYTPFIVYIYGKVSYVKNTWFGSNARNMQNML